MDDIMRIKTVFAGMARRFRIHRNCLLFTKYCGLIAKLNFKLRPQNGPTTLKITPWLWFGSNEKDASCTRSTPALIRCQGWTRAGPGLPKSRPWPGPARPGPKALKLPTLHKIFKIFKYKKFRIEIRTQLSIESVCSNILLINLTENQFYRFLWWLFGVKLIVFWPKCRDQGPRAGP